MVEVFDGRVGSATFQVLREVRCDSQLTCIFVIHLLIQLQTYSFAHSVASSHFRLPGSLTRQPAHSAAHLAAYSPTLQPPVRLPTHLPVHLPFAYQFTCPFASLLSVHFHNGVLLFAVSHLKRSVVSNTGVDIYLFTYLYAFVGVIIGESNKLSRKGPSGLTRSDRTGVSYIKGRPLSAW